MYFRLIITLFFCFPLFLQAHKSVVLDSIPMVKDTITLQEVSVSATQSRKVTGMLSGDIILHVDGIKSVPSRTGTVDVLKVLELTPSVRTSGEGSSNIYVRGGDAGQNLILYNNVTCYTPGHVLGMFPLFNSDHISSLELKKSGVSAQYGDFLSSVIAVKSLSTIPQQTSVKGNVGLLASQLSLAVPLNDKWGVYLSGRKTYIDLLLRPLIKSVTGKDNSDIRYDFWDSNFSLKGEINKKNSLTVDMLLGADDLKMVDEEILLDGYLKWQNAVASVGLQSEISLDSHLEQTFFFSYFKNKLHTKQEEMYVELNSKIEDLGYKNKFSFTFSDDFMLQTGIGYTFHNIKPHQLDLVNSGIVTNSVQEEKIKAHAFSTFISAVWFPTDRLRIEPGLRYNIFDSRTDISRNNKVFNSLDTRLALQYKLTSNIFIRGGYSHNNQYINKLTPSSVGLPTDFWISASNDIKPQSGDEVSVGYYHALFDGGWEISADAYLRTMRNSTEFDYNFLENDNQSFTQKIKYGKGNAIGLEVMIKKNFDKLTGWVGYALGKADRKFEELNGGKSFPARFDRTHDLSLTMNYKFNPKWDASFTYIYATGNTYTQPTSWYFINNLPVKEYTRHNNARMPNYNRVDIGVNYWLSKNNSFNFSLYNMFAVENPIYVFMVVKRNWSDNIEVEIKKKNLFTLIPSISWNFKF